MTVLFIILNNVWYFVYRTPNGKWSLIPRTYVPNQILRRLTIRLTVYAPSTPEEQAANAAVDPTIGRGKDKEPCFAYEGGLNKHSLTDDEVKAGGNYLVIDDLQIKPMMKGRNIFEYSVELNMQSALPQ